MTKPLYILLPGLNDDRVLFTWFYQLVIRRWQRKGLMALLVPLQWNTTENLQTKVERVVEVIQKQQGREVVLVGCSAGAAIAMAVFAQATKVKRLVLVSGYIQVAPHTENYAGEVWHQAALAAEEALTSLSEDQRSHIISLYPSHDLTIAPERAQVRGGHNILMSVSGHLLSIVLGLWQYVPMVVMPLVNKTK